MHSLLKHISPRTKVFFFAFTLILVPGAILSYLGFRSISEKAENLTSTHRGTVGLVRDKIESEISGLEESLRMSLSDLQVNSDSSEEIKAWLNGMKMKYPGLGRLFFVNPQGGIISTRVSLGWVKGKGEPGLEEVAGLKEFRAAEESEFVRKDCAGAVRLYRNALSKTRTPAGRSLVLSRIGRCYFKLKRHREGIAEYRKVLALPSRESGSGYAPSSVVALSQISDGYALLGEEKARRATLFTLYEHLLRLPWDLERGDYSYYLRFTMEEVDPIVNISSDASGTDQGIPELRMRARSLIDEVEFIQYVHHTVVPQALAEMSRSIVPVSEVIRIPFSLYDSMSEVNCLRLPGSSRRSVIYALGYVNSEEYFVSTLLPRVLDSVDLGKDLVVGVLDHDGIPRFLQKHVPTSRYLSAENFSGTYTAWKVALFHPDGKTVEELVAGDKAIYLTLFVGIVAVMAIGIVVIGRAALHELEAARMKSEFVSSVSHELKTPLALIRMFGETLESGLVSDEGKRQEFYSIITRESERLTHLINNVLDFSRMETGKKQYHFEEDDIVHVVVSTLEAYRFHIRDLGFEMVTQVQEEPILMVIDKDAISQALLNLLNNASKYSEAQKYIRVELTKNADWVLIAVEDRGVGIPQDELAKIFQKFYRASTARTRETTGSGLGLTLVKHIAEAHAGFVDVSSSVGEGSRFVLRLPLRRTADS